MKDTDWQKILEAHQLLEQNKAEIEKFKLQLKNPEVQQLIGRNIKLLMALRQIDTIADLSRSTGIDTAHLSRIIHSKTNFSLEQFINICSKLKVLPVTMASRDLIAESLQLIDPAC